VTFRVGQKVVCVEPIDELVKGEIYTISAVGRFDGGENVMVDVAEIQNYAPYAWYSYRFRPIVERRTDISIFKKMLKPRGVDA